MSATTHHPLINCQPYQPTLADRAAFLARSVTDLVRRWRARIKERRDFPLHDHRLLSDLRLSRWEIEQELKKPFWRG